MVEATLTRSMPACSHGGLRSRERSVIRCANSFTLAPARFSYDAPSLLGHTAASSKTRLAIGKAVFATGQPA